MGVKITNSVIRDNNGAGVSVPFGTSSTIDNSNISGNNGGGFLERDPPQRRLSRGGRSCA